MYFKFWLQTDNLLNKEYCWKLLLNSVKALSILSVIGTIEPAYAYFSGGFADSRALKELKNLHGIILQHKQFLNIPIFHN